MYASDWFNDRLCDNPLRAVLPNASGPTNCEEADEMNRTRTQRELTRGTSVRRIAAAAVAMGAMSTVFLAPDPATAATNPRTASVVSTAKNSTLGTILVAKTTVYTLKPSKRACKAACLKAWPPVLLPPGTTNATAGTGVHASKLGTAAAANGARQVTYGGKRLYWFVKDKARGQVKGNVTDKWGKWSTVVTVKSPSGSKTPSTTSAGTGGAGF
jgi:predicted lipoprotein with Yx(FWY)xxD motif